LPEIFKLLELSFLASIPTKLEEGAQAPVYVRFRVNTKLEDAPGSVRIDDLMGPGACPTCGHTPKGGK
jgi:hypothetical protein